jgi:hypothetical protein
LQNGENFSHPTEIYFIIFCISSSEQGQNPSTKYSPDDVTPITASIMVIILSTGGHNESLVC